MITKRRYMILAAVFALFIVMCACFFGMFGFLQAVWSGAATGQSAYDDTKRVLELLNFASGPGLIVLACVAGLVAYFQFKEAEHSRHATLYISIVEQWNSDGLVKSRRNILEAIRDYNKNKVLQAKYPKSSAYLAAKLEDLKNSNLMDHREYILILTFFEDIGNLCRKGYVREADIFDFMCAQIIARMENLSDYIVQQRNLNSGIARTSTYASALYLYKRAKLFNDPAKGTPTIYTQEADFS